MTAPIIFPKGVPVGYIFSYGARRWKKTASDPDVWDSLTTTDALVERAESAAYDAEAAKQAAEAAADIAI